MPISLTRNKALQELHILSDLGKRPAFRFPAFCIETEFIYLFTHILDRTEKRNNVAPFMNTLIKKAYEQSVDEICRLLDAHKIRGVEIFSLMGEKNLIRNREKKPLHNKLPGKAAQSLVDSYVNRYNNWLLASLFWKAYIQSHDAEYRFHISEEEDASPSEALLYDPKYKPLWALKEAYIKAGRPTHGYASEDIFIRPIAEWYRFIKTSKKPPTKNGLTIATRPSK